MRVLMKLLREEEGVTLIEYALISVIIAIALFASLQSISSTLNGFYQSVADAFNQ